MTLFAFLTDINAAGTRATLLSKDTLFIDEGVTVARSDGSSSDAVILALAGSNIFDIRGNIVGNGIGIKSGDDPLNDGSSNITVASTGMVKSFQGTAISMLGTANTVTNHGWIEGAAHGILMSGDLSATENKIVNTGTIAAGIAGVGGYAIYHSSTATQALTIHNTGTIRGGLGSFSGSNAEETIINEGTVAGDVFFAGGADRYDGRQGTMQGVVYGAHGADTLLGGAGNDQFKGEDDADYLEGGAGNDILEGGAGSDGINGGSGNDRLDGGTEADEMHGGTGNDTFIVDNSGDLALELAGEGTDMVEASVSYTLLAGLEKLTLTGVSDIDGTGNSVANVLAGNEGKNTLKGLAGNDLLDGGLNVDRLEGGTGNDTYVIDNAGDVVVELAGAGTDLVKAYASYVLSSNVERLTLLETSDINGTGNVLDNILTGNAGKNILKGMAGNDLIDGRAGIDRLEGGAGNDTYIVDNSGDVVIELGGAGTDTVKASKSYTLSTNVEKLILTGTTNINGTGGLDANTLTGNAGKNTLKGMDGNDLLDGGAGIDRLEGGLGNDTYKVDSSGDVVVELADAGTDTVVASVSHTLSANVEKLILTGSANLNGAGNALANTLTGNAGNNILKGMAGNDVVNGGGGIDQLFGGAGKDMFVFSSAADSKAAAQDKIFDFSQAEGDRIDLKGVDANALLTGDQAFSFIAGSAFHKTAGELRFEVKSGDTIVQGDADGNGLADFSFVLDTAVTLKAGDFLL